MSMVTGVFQQAPTVQPYPYVTMGNGQKAPWCVFQKVGANILLYLDIWADINDGDRCLLILAEIDRLLDYKALGVMTNYTNALIYNELSVYVPEEVQQLRHLTARYRTLNSLN